MKILLVGIFVRSTKRSAKKKLRILDAMRSLALTRCSGSPTDCRATELESGKTNT